MITHVLVFGLFRAIHLLAAIVAVGGTFMLRYGVMGALAAQPPDVRQAVHEQVRRRLALIYPTAIGLLLISGIVNLVRAFTVPPMPVVAYHIILTVKLLLALALFVVAIMLVIPPSPGNAIQRNRQRWITFNMHAGVLIVLLSVALRFLSGK